MRTERGKFVLYVELAKILCDRPTKVSVQSLQLDSKSCQVSA